jgi:hypothetical protein
VEQEGLEIGGLKQERVEKQGLEIEQKQERVEQEGLDIEGLEQEGVEREGQTHESGVSGAWKGRVGSSGGRGMGENSAAMQSTFRDVKKYLYCPNRRG